MITRLENLEKLFTNWDKGNNELLRYFPIGLIACIEGYYSIVIKELIDFGSPFYENISKLKSVQQIDFEIFKAIQQKTISLGDFVAHLLPINNLGDINTHLSILTGKDYLEELKSVYDRFEVEVLKKEKKNIIDDASVIYQGINKTFELRHIFAHEIADTYELNSETIEVCFRSVKSLIKATSEFISELLNPNAPLTQPEMNEQSGKDLANAIAALEKCEVDLKSLLTENHIKKFSESQEYWKELYKLDSEFQADIVCEGGTIWPTIYNSSATSFVYKRIEYLEETIEVLKNF